MLRSSVARLLSTLACLLLPLVGASPLHAGEVWTTDGRILEGLVKVDPRGDFMVIAPNSSTTRVKADETIFAWFGSMRGLGGFTPPPPLRPTSIGESKAPAISVADGIYTLTGQGSGLAGAADACACFFQDIGSNAEVTARVTEITPATGRLGITIRQSAAPGAPHATLLVTASGDLVFQYRAEEDKPTVTVAAGKVKFPVQLKLVRQGRQVTWYRPRNEQVIVGGAVYTDRQYDQWLSTRQGAEPGLALSSAASAGLLLSSGDAPDARATVDSISVRDIPGPAGIVPPDNVENWLRKRVQETQPGLWLRSGSFLASAAITAVGDRQLSFTDSSGTPGQVDLNSVVRVNLTSLSPSLADGIPADSAGALLSSGEFMEGQFSNWKDHHITISSVVFGISTFRVPEDVRAMVWNARRDPATRWTLWLRDGSILAADSVRADGIDITIDEPVLGKRRLAAKEVYALRAGRSVVTPLSSLRPQKTVTRSLQRQFTEASCFDEVWGNYLAVGARGAVDGIIAPWASEVVYDIPAGSSRFLCWMGVPDRISGLDQDVRIVVLLDGVKALQLPPLKSKEPRTIPLTLLVAGKKSLSLRIEGDHRQRQGFAICADGVFTMQAAAGK